MSGFNIILILITIVVVLLFLWLFISYIGVGIRHKKFSEETFMKKFLLAHRGDLSNKFLENSKAAFDNAMTYKRKFEELGFTFGLEVDVRLTKDKKILCIHDNNFQNLIISETDSSEINKFYQKATNQKPLYLEDLFKNYPEVIKFIDLKFEDYESSIEIVDSIFNYIKLHNIPKTETSIGSLMNHKLNKYIIKNYWTETLTRTSFKKTKLFLILYYLGVHGFFKPNADFIEIPFTYKKKKLCGANLISQLKGKQTIPTFWEQKGMNQSKMILKAFRNKAKALIVNNLEETYKILSKEIKNENE